MHFSVLKSIGAGLFGCIQKICLFFINKPNPDRFITSQSLVAERGCRLADFLFMNQNSLNKALHSYS